MGYLSAGWIPVIFGTLWLYFFFMSRAFPAVQGKRVLLLIAHPDDEAMFFAPTIQALMSAGNQVKILCLSNGNADGLGDVREKELRKSVTCLGLKPQDVILIDDPNLQDSQDAWSAQHISRILLTNLAPTLSKTPEAKPPKALIDVIVTFDEDGVSSHPNHRACSQGASLFLADLMRGREGWESPVTVYVLSSVSTSRKYIHLLDAVLTMPVCMWRVVRQGGTQAQSRHRDPRKAATIGAAIRSSISKGAGSGAGEGPSPLFFVAGPVGWYRALKAMVCGHWSQMVWFRWGWIALGRYLLINDLRKLRSSGAVI